MSFNSFQFLVFFPIVVILYYAIPKKIRPIWLVIASYYFYMSWNAKYAVLILTSTIITYLSGILLGKAEKVSSRKWIVAGSFITNLGILVMFKYFAFFLSNLNKVLGILHVSAIDNPFSFVLPVGISFYTFQALSYTVDVYRHEIEPEKNFINYALFVSFFPQLVAGPIERSGNLLTQIQSVSKKKLFDYDKFVKGFSLMCWGMFVKMVIADRVAIFVDTVFNSIYNIGSVEALFGALGFTLQIYCDFSGYSLIAIGAANVMGFDLMENFNTPYFAESIQDFWRRWHISLSTWFRDYLYIPLGGSRCSKLRKYFNIMVTFLVSGLWHGAAWTFVIWGGLHGIYQIVGDLLRPVKKKVNELLKVNTEAFSFKFGRIITTFFLTVVAWIFFKAGSIGVAFRYLRALFTKWNPWVFFDSSLYEYGLDRPEAMILLWSILALFVVDVIRYKKGLNIGEFLVKQNLWFRWIVLIVLIVCCLVFGEYGIDFDSSQFIYFQF